MAWPMSLPNLFPMLLALAAGVWDLRTGRVPNLLTLPAMAAGLLLRFPPDPEAVLTTLAIALLFWGLGVTGGGDAKLWLLSWILASLPLTAARRRRGVPLSRPAPAAWKALPAALWLALGAPLPIGL
jgi:Flp pilus assembly protein protease CpaA